MNGVWRTAAVTGLLLIGGAQQGADAQPPPKPPAKGGWVADASKAAIPAQKLTGRLANQPFQVQRVVWRRQAELGFSDAPVTVMVLEIHGQTPKPHGLDGLPPGLKLSDVPASVRAQFAKAGKTATWEVTIALRKGEAGTGSEIVHRPKDPPGAPENAAPGRPVLLGAELRVDATTTMAVPYSMRLRLDAPRGSNQPGALYLCLNDGKQSYVAGTFEAILKK